MSCTNPDTSFETLLAAVLAGTMTAEELQQIPTSSLTYIERQAILIAASQLAACIACSAASSTNLPAPKSAVRKRVVGGNTENIPPTIEYSFSVIDTNATATQTVDGTHQVSADTATSGNESPENGEAHVSPRVDGQAHPAFDLTPPVGITLFLQYTPA